MVHKPIQILHLAVIVLDLIGGTQSANILGLFPSLSASHLIVQMSAAKVLAERGHNVTVVTVLKPVVNHKNIQIIQVPLSKKDAQRHSDIIGSMSKNDNSNYVISLFRMLRRTDFLFRKMVDALKDQRVRDLYLNSENKFDLILSGYFINEFQFGFAKKVNAPVIALSPMPPSQMVNHLIGNPLEVSYLSSNNNSLEKGKGITFRERLIGFTNSIFINIFNYLSARRNKNFYKELFADDPTMPEYDKLIKNTSLVFFATHALSEGPIRPNVPAAIEIGGIHIKDKPDPLPRDLSDFLGNAPEGVILLSLGSNVRSSHIKPDTMHKMINVLSKLKQRVIWKWDDLENVPGMTGNILYSKWLPQDDILAHPNLKLFITHAGKGGITEAQFHGKPMLALPIFGDQPENANAMSKKGFGLTLSLLTLDEQPFHDAIQEILTNPRYAETVAKFSALYRDRPLSARESVIYWTEYVIRHHGAAHLQSPLVHMGCIAANNLDIYALLALILVALLLLLKAVVKIIYRRCTSKTKIVKKPKKLKNI